MHNIGLDLTARMDLRIDRIEDKLDEFIARQDSRDDQMRTARRLQAEQQQGAARNANNSRFANHSTVSPEPTPAPLVSLLAELKIKREDLGVFDPDADDPRNNRVLIEGRCIVFTDIYSFEQRVLSLLEVEPDKQDAVNRQLVQHFGACLNSSAIMWWKKR
jgi:hypothetical protein